MKVLIVVFGVGSGQRIKELIAPVADAFEKLSPKAARESSRAFLGNIKDLGIASCSITDDEWESALSSIRKEHREFSADFILAAGDVAAMVDMADKLPTPIRLAFSTFADEDFGVAWLPMDEEVLDGRGL